MRSREAYKKTVAVLTRIRTNSSIKVQDVSIVCMTVLSYGFFAIKNKDTKNSMSK